MKTTTARIALLTGASLTALGLAVPANAQDITSPGISQTDVTPPVTDTLVICNLADLPADCFYGVVDEDPATATANVNTVAIGEIEQIGTAPSGDVNLLIVNDGDAVIGAYAEAGPNEAGPAVAVASVQTAIYQEGTGPEDVNLTVDNNGSLLITADADADGDSATATADLYRGIYQDGTSTGIDGIVTVTLTNDGPLAVVADADAFADDVGGIAVANATIGEFIWFTDLGAAVQQQGDGDTVAINLVNSDSLSVAATANATGDAGAAATAHIAGPAIWQIADAGEGGGVATLTNEEGAEIAVSALATAVVTGDAGAATAYASVTAAMGQYVSAIGGSASATLTNAGTIGMTAIANATGADAAEADALAFGDFQYAFGYEGGAAHVGVVNTGSVTLHAGAAAVADDAASADVLAEHVFIQNVGSVAAADTPGGDASADISNTGSIGMSMTAVATADIATASASGNQALVQYVSAIGFGVDATEEVSGDAAANLVNEGSVTIAANATANGDADADADAMLGGFDVADALIYQNAISEDGDATVTLSNLEDGTIEAEVNAVAVATEVDGLVGSADAEATIASAIFQSALANGAGDAFVNLDNAGEITLAANATATGITVADADADIDDGIRQQANVNGALNTATLSVFNEGTVSLVANANADADDADADAEAGWAMVQSAFGTAGLANLTLTNDGTVTASANAVAVGGAGALVDVASADAEASGILQTVGGGLATGNLVLNNTGTLNVFANATATAQEDAYADADAIGVRQELDAGTVNTGSFTNSGEINVAAFASADSLEGGGLDAFGDNADAVANGYMATGGTGTLTAINSGTMVVNATAVAAETADAFAGGMRVLGFTGGVTLSNAATLTVVADASGGVASEASALGMTRAFATGNSTITNSGTLAVDAITHDGGEATAAGIIAFTTGVAAEGDLTTINNDGGTIIVRESIDGGTSWRRGVAITSSPLGFESTTPTVVNLLGEGEIYGNIDINAGDEINVADGTTYLDGIINPDFMPVGGVVEATLDTGLFGEGTLNIEADGNLILAGPNSDMFDDEGPSYAFVESFNMDPAGTITFELQPEAGGIQPVGTYPQIFTNVANLDGTLVADVTPADGLFADDFFWDNVIDAVTRNGTFDQCVLAGAYANSPLLTGAFEGDICDYDEANNVDLGIVRVAFDAVAGLDGNQLAVAGGLECLYEDADLTELAGTGMGEAIAELFLFDGEGYAGALQQLSGAGYAGYLQSFNSLGYHYNQILARATDCEIPALAGSALACRVAPMHLWGQLDYDTLSQDGDTNLGDYDADRWSFLIGGDISITPAAVVGLSVGKVTNKVDYDDLGGRVKGDGWQFGAYGTFDPGQFYVKALATYTKMDGDGRRGIDFTPFGGTIAGEIEGDVDVRMWTFGLHSGYRIPMGDNSVITPFLNYDYTNAKMKGFSETGDTGVELAVNGGREKHSWLTGGVKWAGQMGGLVPEASIGYRHMFGDRNASFNANFAGFEEDCDFDIVSMTEKRGAVLAGLSVGGLLGMVDVRVGYNGAFNSDMQEHSGFLKLVVPLGAVAVPPPPPVIAPAPPPPAPATQTCPDGSVILATDVCPAPPPPPPPPAPAPERG